MASSTEDAAPKQTERAANPFASDPIVAAPSGASAQALVQREVAEVQAAMAIAQRFPRDPKAAMDRVLTACTRPSLAEAAMYQYARGGQNVEGASIRLAEELARQWGNMLAGVTELERKNGVSECLAYAWDLETNYRDEKRFQVRHWRDTKRGGYAVTEERDIYELIANMGARRKRACILAVVPGDVQESAVHQCRLTLHTNEEVTPERIEKMTAAFGKYGVTREMIEKRIQRRLDEGTPPALIVQLRNIYNSLKDGMSRPEDWFEMGEQAPTNDEQGAAPQSKSESVKDRMRGRQQQAAEAQADAPAEDSEQQEAPGEPQQSDAIPQYDTASAVKALESKRNTKTLGEQFNEIAQDFANTDRPLPDEVQAKYDELHEVLSEKEKEL